MTDFSLFDGFSPRRMTVDEYVDYIETGHRERGVYLPSGEDYDAAIRILVERGVIDARSAVPVVGAWIKTVQAAAELAGE